jgi:hypothetical protein
VPQLGVLATDDGEAGAVSLYGPAYAYQRPLAG